MEEGPGRVLFGTGGVGQGEVGTTGAVDNCAGPAGVEEAPGKEGTAGRGVHWKTRAQKEFGINLLGVGFCPSSSCTTFGILHVNCFDLLYLLKLVRSTF